MRATLKKICREGMEPWLEDPEFTREREECSMEIRKMRQKLLEKLDGDKEHCLDRFESSLNFLTAVISENTFLNGFRLAIRMIVESLSS